MKYGQRIHLQFLEFDVEDDTACMADFLEIYDSYDDINGFVGRYSNSNFNIKIIKRYIFFWDITSEKNTVLLCPISTSDMFIILVVIVPDNLPYFPIINTAL